MTGSGIERAMNCPTSEVLPHVSRSSVFAEAGTMRHLLLSLIKEKGRDGALAEIPEEHREMCAAIDIEGLPTDLAAEVTYAYDPATQTARELGRNLDRDYSGVRPGEIVGTIDVVGLAPHMAYLGDYKGHERVSAKQNAQLLFPALCLSKMHDITSATLEIIQIGDGDNFRSKWHADIFDIGAYEERLLATVATIAELKESGDLHPVEGKHCKYCPAFDSCPAKTKMIRVMADGAPLDSLLPIRPETAPQALVTLRRMEELTKKARAAVYAYASERPIPTADGKLLGKVTKMGSEKLDGDIVYQVVRNELGQDAADLAVKRIGTKSGIKEAVRAANLDETQKSANDRLLYAIREKGGAKREPKESITEYRPELKQ